MAVQLPEVKSVVFNGVSIEYLEYDGEDPAILMLHATGFLPWLWHPIVKRMGLKSRVIAPYFCDHRHEEPENGGVSWLLLARDLRDLCEALEIEKPLLVGHSMGATVITLACAVHELHAERVIIIEPIFLPEQVYSAQLTVEQHPLASKSINRRNGWSDRDEALSYLKSKPLFSRWDPETLELYLEHGMVPGQSGGLTLACSPRREAALFMGGVTHNPWPLLEQITNPTLILEGEASENRAYINLEKAASLMQSGTHKLVKEAGHLVPMEKPDETVGIIKEYFNL